MPMKLLLAVLLLILPVLASASPVTYTAYTVTDGTLGTWKFTDAEVWIVMETDTVDIQTICNFGGTGVNAYYNSTGTTQVIISTPTATVRATVSPGQLAATMDKGRDPGCALNLETRGVGFGMFSPLLPNGPYPTYPVGINWGTVWETSSNAADLSAEWIGSGGSWTCVDFPTGSCPAATVPIRTSHGNLFLSQKAYSPGTGATNLGGTFTIKAGHIAADVGPAWTKTALQVAATLKPTPVHAIAYTGSTVNDFSLNGQLLIGAQLELRFVADPSTAHSFADPLGAGTMVDKGIAEFTLRDRTSVYRGTIAAGEVFVYFDAQNFAAGFGSTKAGRGYPLALTPQGSWGNVLDRVLLLYQGYVDPAIYSLVYWTGTPGASTPYYRISLPTAFSAPTFSCPNMQTFAGTLTCNPLLPGPVALDTSAGPLIVYQHYNTSSPYPIPGTVPDIAGFFQATLLK